ncbi:MAG: membrane protein insertase YidC [Rikenellaceae bacterium]|nr:membrane protein insertase YidC [Rikenellaceae bacterium]
MDKNSVIGLVLIGALLVGYSFYTNKQQQEYEKAQAEWIAAHPELAEPTEVVDTTAVVAETATIAGDTLTAEQRQQRADEALNANLGNDLFAALRGADESFEVENDVIKVTFSNRGAQITGVELKDYMRYAEGERTEPIQLYREGSAEFDICMYIHNGVNNVRLNTRDYAFHIDPVQKIDDYQQVVMRLPVSGASAIEYVYKIYDSESPARNYMVDFDVRMIDMESLMANQTQLDVVWRNISLRNEKGFQTENMATTIAYRFPGEGSIEELSVGERAEETENTRVNWVAFKQQFFSSVLIAENSFDYASMRYTTFPEGSEELKSFNATMSIPYSKLTTDYKFQFYFGPNKYSILNKCVSENDEPLYLERLIPLGWGIFGWVNRWFVIPMFDFLSKYIGNFGWIILIMTIVIKLLISPLTYKSYVSMAKMRVIKPEMDEINARYPKQEDAMKKQQAVMDLYQRAGVSPMGGCLPMLIQMPILIAMFRFFPASIELRGESFLWAEDLSTYDSVLNLPFNIPWYGDHVSLFALLMAISLFVYSWINYQQTAASQPQMAGMKFMTLYMMPVMMLLWFNSYSSGLCYYYFISQLITIAMTYGIRAMLDDDKVRAQMQANAKKKKNKKKSRFQQRYEELMKQQQEMLREQQAQQQRRK